MIIDKLLQFSDKQNVLASAVSTNVVDMGANTDNPAADIGTGQELYLGVVVSAAFAGLTGLTIELVSDTAANLTTAPTVHVSSGSLAPAALAAGSKLFFRLPAGSYKRFIGLKYTVAGTGTAGTLSAFLVNDVDQFRAYADRQPIAGNA